MIRNEQEYREAIRRIEADRQIRARQRAELAKHKMKKEEIERAMSPLLAFHNQLVEEVDWYESVKRGDLGTISSLQDIKRLLIALRIGNGMTQRALARRLDVTEAQVSRDERNEYHGITMERAQKILNVFRVHFKSKVETEGLTRRDKALVEA